MSNIKNLCIATAVAGAMALGAMSPATAEIDERKFTVVGTWHFLALWKHHESRLWKTVLPEASGGKITANVRPLTELGMKGFELMRQLKAGVFDFAHGVTSYVASDAPAIEGVDLAGVVQDLATYRKVMEAYRPVLEREFDQRFNSKILMLYSFPSQQLWCNLKDHGVRPQMPAKPPFWAQRVNVINDLTMGSDPMGSDPDRTMVERDVMVFNRTQLGVLRRGSDPGAKNGGQSPL